MADMLVKLYPLPTSPGLEEALRDDRVKNVVHGFTRLGLLEMTRKRTGDSLRDLLTTPCSKCCETGRIYGG